MKKHFHSVFMKVMTYEKRANRDIYEASGMWHGVCLHPACCLKGSSLTGRELEQYHITPSPKSKVHILR